MTVEVAIGVYLIVHVLSVYLLRASGTWRVLFARILPAPDRTPDPLRVAPRGWIENHSFWDLHPTETGDDTDAEVIFWGDRRSNAG